MQTLGIDEAGRGCVLGPLVVAIVAASDADRRWFRDHNVRDSKKVPPKERERLAQEIKARCWFSLTVCTPPEIDDAVRDRTRTLNGLERERMAHCLQHFLDTFPNERPRVMIDAPSINAAGFRNQLLASLAWPCPELLRAEHHADANDRTVGAASIIAKDERERLLALIQRELGVSFGSGYPGDERTITHLRTVSRGAPHVRWTWATATQVR